jgi:hypothetical protein
MLPHMTVNECMLFLSFLRNTDKYVEFGCGGSTVLAASYVNSVVSVDSSQEWIDKIRNECGRGGIDPYFLYVDIGPVGDWGTPQVPNDNWTKYHTEVWKLRNSCDADLYLVDGRFRVACFAQILLHCAHPIIALHDFTSRKKDYSIIKEVAREVASVDDLSFFVRKPLQMNRIKEILELHQHDYR